MALGDLGRSDTYWRYLIFSPLTYNGEVTKLTWPKVTDIKIRNIQIVDTYMSLLYVHCEFQRVRITGGLWHDVKLRKTQLEVRSLNVTWRRDLWGHPVIVFWKCVKLLAWQQLWQIWRHYAPPFFFFFSYLRKTWGWRITATGPFMAVRGLKKGCHLFDTSRLSRFFYNSNPITIFPYGPFFNIHAQKH